MASCGSCVLATILFVQFLVMFPALVSKVKLSGFPNFLSHFLPFGSPSYTVIIAVILEKLERKGGFFMRYDMASYESILAFTCVLIICWLGAGFVSLVLMYEHFWRIGFFFFTCAVSTAVIPCLLSAQASKYELQMIEITQENLAVGQALTDEQVQTIYRLNVYHNQVQQSIVKKDGYGRKIDDGRAKAIQAETYFKLQKWMQEMRQAEHGGVDSYQIRDIYNQMAQHCRNIELSPTERQQIQQVAHMDVIACSASTSGTSNLLVNAHGQHSQNAQCASWRRDENGGWTRNGERHGSWRRDRSLRLDRRQRSQSYLDLRTEIDAPPTYAASLLSLYNGDGRRGCDV